MEILNSLGSYFTRVVAAIMTLVFSLSFFFGYKPPEVAPVLEAEEVEMMSLDEGYSIVKSASASTVDNVAADTLQNYLSQICGTVFPIITDTAAPSGNEIIVGITNREGSLYDIDRAALGDEGIHIEVADGNIIITGGAVRGTLYAVYSFLEKYLDCHWYAEDCIDIPTADTLEIPAVIDYTYVPALAFRETDWLSPRNITYSVANKLNGKIYRPLGVNEGGGVGYAVYFAHSLQSIFTPDVMAANPECRALGFEAGVLTDRHPCLSKEKTYEITLQKVREALTAVPDAQIVTVTHPDNMDYCVCDECMAVYDVEGSPAGLMLRFVNRIADEIKADYPQVKVDTFAYQYTRKAPKITVPRDNVIVRLCSIECCFVHNLDDPDCERNADFAKDISDWKAICPTLHIWDYTTNYGNFNGPFNDWNVLQPNMQFFVNNNVVGVYEEGNYYASVSNGEFADLRSYLLAQLMWDSEIDYHKAMVEFCDAYYGEAGKDIMKYLTLLMNRTGGKDGKSEHLKIFDYMGNDGNMLLSLADIKYADDLWAHAKSLNLTAEQLRRVRASEISWRYWKSTKKVSDFNPINLYTANTQLFNDMKELGISRISESGPLAEKPFMLDDPGRWTPDRLPDFNPGWFY